MATPTDEQQLRATLRRAERNVGTADAALMALTEGVAVLGVPAMVLAAHARLPVPAHAVTSNDAALPPLMGAAEAADVLGMKATNLKRLSPPLPVAAIVSGRVPVYLASDVHAAKARRDARKAGA